MTGRAPRAAYALSALVLSAAATGLALAAPPPGLSADALGWLMGRWAGHGNLIPASGTPEAYKCVVTYRRGDDGLVQQNLRCNGQDSKLDASTHLRIEGERVTGSWEEHTHSLSGDVKGTMTAAGFDISLSGQFFNAAMRVAGSECQQDVTLTPVKADFIREMSATLRKC